jgi:hypothetical protein
MPDKPELRLSVVVANTGAGATFINEFQLRETFKHHARAPAPFDRVRLPRKADPHVVHRSGGAERLPFVFDRGEAKSYELRADLPWIEELDPPRPSDGPLRRQTRANEAEQLARYLARLGDIDLVLEWAYRRRKLFIPWARSTKRGSLDVRNSGASSPRCDHPTMAARPRLPSLHRHR